MRKTISVLFALAMIFALSGCGAESGAAPESDFELASEPPSDAAFGLFDREPAAEEPAPSEATPAPNAEDIEAAEIFRAFLSENYTKLNEASFNSIAGIGFIDLDLDGSRELILFDAGASASMGVEIFDIVDGEVECICANIEQIGLSFNLALSDGIIVNANFMEDFRLMENKSTGERFFIVTSTNGNVDESYSEVIRFGSKGGALTLTSLLYRYEEYDDTGLVTLQRFRVNGAEAALSEYISASEKLSLESSDTGLECVGVFVWENNEYVENYDNFMAMADKALALSAENVPKA